MSAFLTALEDFGLSPRTVTTYRDSLASFFEFLVTDCKLMAVSPIGRQHRRRFRVDQQRVVRGSASGVREILSADECRAFLRWLNASPWAKNPPAPPLPIACGLALMLCCGLRSGEVVRLPASAWNPIDRDDGSTEYRLVITGKGNKTRQVEIPPVAVEMIQRMRREWKVRRGWRHAMLCHRNGRPWSETTVQRWAKIGLAHVGRPSASSHMLRRTCASHHLRAGAPIDSVARLLGHASVRTTSTAYIVDPPNVSTTLDWAQQLPRANGS